MNKLFTEEGFIFLVIVVLGFVTLWLWQGWI
jgi:hypothetical protein